MEAKMPISISIVDVGPPEGCNVILGLSHFIKTVEDVFEALINTVPQARFGIGFVESSGKCLVRHEGNDEELRKLAADTAFKLAAGHSFVIFLKNAYPINVLHRLKAVPEVCNIYCATGNPIQVIIAETEQGRGILGVIDGFKTQGTEGEKDIEERREFLRKIGYKF